MVTHTRRASGLETDWVKYKMTTGSMRGWQKLSFCSLVLTFIAQHPFLIKVKTDQRGKEISKSKH